MDLVNLLSKLQAIEVSEAEEKKADKDYDGDGKIESGKDEYMGSRMKAASKSKANEDIFNVLQGLKAIQEGDDACPKCGEVHEGACDKSKVEECGDMEMSPLTNPSAGYDMAPMAAMAQQAEPEMAAEPAPEEKPMFSLTITNGDNNLTMMTDVPDEIIHVMKLAGVGAKAEVKKNEPEGQAKEVEEAWANTPDTTKERDPKAYGDIRDWGFKGTGHGQKGSAMNKPFGQGDNPLSENAIIDEYKSFKTQK